MFVHTPTTAKNIENIKTSLETSNAVLIQGEIGCGKTLAVDYLSNLLGVKETLIQIDVDDSFDSKDLLGKFSATETPGSFQWIPGPLTLAVEKGYWVLMEDIDLASFDVFSVLLSLLENSTLFISDKNRIIAAHPNFKLIATQQIVVSGDALFSKKNAIPHQELWGTVIMSRIPSNEQCEIVHQMYNRVPLPVLEALASFPESCSTSKVINLRTLLRWGKRVSRRLELHSSETNSLTFFSSTIREMLLKEAYDCFVARFPTGGEHEIVFKAICSACGVSLEVAETAILQSKPQHLIGLTDCTFGRITLALKAPSRVTRESRIAFAETRQAMSLLEQLASTVENGEHVLLTGETGVGKTFVVQYLADQVGQNLIVHNLNQQTDTSDFMGGWKPLDLGFSMKELFTWFNELFASCFSVEKNAEFLCAIQNAFSSRNWEKTIRLIQKGCSSFCQKYLKQGGFSTEIMSQWNELKAKADETLNIVMQTSSNMAFFYEEGSLVKAWREGHWILLDELNLATTEVLERVSSVLGDVDRLFLTDKGSSEAIPRHKNFCVFANMNPPTDVGKKDLPPSLRSRFTEFYVSEPFNVSDISTIVREYLSFLTPDAKIHEITEFFLDCVSNAKSKLCSLDGESKPPSFSVRTLTRALSYVRKATPYYGFNVSLFDGLLLGFATPLQRQFHKVIEGLIVKNIFRGKQPSSPKLPSSPSQGEHVAYEHIWIKAGANEPFNDENFILTDSVKGHLTNLSRAVFANRPVLLEGPTSSGKSSMVQYLAQLTGNTFVRINNHDSTEVQEYLGHYVTDEFGKLRFVDGILVNAVRNGYWVVLDELNLAPTDVLEALNRLLDDNCELFIPDTQETIKPHPGLRIFATQNPAGIYGGRKVLSRAFRNRFLEITVDEIPSDEIIVILKRRYSMPEGFATKVVQIMTNLQLRRQSSQIFAGRHGFITPRDLFRWADRRPSTYQELAEHGFLLLGERCRKETERQIVKDVIESVTKTVICENEIYIPSHWPFVNKYYQLIHSGTIDEFKIVWTTSMQRLFTVVGVCLEHLEPVLLVGETGSSKTTVCQLWSALVGVPLRIINFHQHSEAADFLGSLRPVLPDRKDQALFEWRDGPLVECMREGFFILLDEISLTEDSVLERLNSVLEPSRSITLAEKSSGESFVAHEGFRVLATMNPGGDFGKKELSPALRNRFTEVYVRPTTEEGEVATIVSKRLLPQLREKWSVMMARVLCRLSKLVLPSSGGSTTHISIRDIISWVEFMNAVDGKCVEELAFAHGLDALLLDGIGVGTGQVEGAIEVLKKTCLHEIENALGDLFPPLICSCMQFSSDAQMESLAILPPSSSSIPSAASLHSVQELVDKKPFWEVLMGMEEPTLPPHLLNRFFFGAPTTQRNLSKLMRSTVLCKAVLLEGSPGVGKTSIVEALGAALGVRVVRINLSEQTDVMDLFGTFLPQVADADEAEKDGKTEEEKEKRKGSGHESDGVEQTDGEGKEQSIGAEDNLAFSNKEKAKGAMFAWSDGVLLQALKEGCWAILDELNLASQSVLEGLNALLDHRAAVFIPEINQSFSAHPNFRIFACQNPLAEGGGRKGLPRSFLNRFVKVRMEAFTREDLMVISQSICPDIPSVVLSGMVDFVAELQRETMWKRSFGLRGSPWEFNLRDVLRWANLLRRYEEQCNPMAFANMLFELRFRTDEDRLQCRTILHKYFLLPKREKAEEDNASPLHFSDSNLPVSLPLPKTSVYSSDFLLVGSTIVYKGRPLLERLSSEDMPFPPYTSSPSATSLALHETMVSPPSANAFRSGETNEDNLASCTSFSPSHLDRPLLLLPSQADIVAAILMCAAQSQFAILVGTSGSGKTFSLRTAAALAGATLVTFSINASCDTVDLLGGFDQVEDKQGEFEWRDSLILEAMVQGHWLVLDNVNYCHASVLDRLNPLVEPNGVLSVNEQGLVQGRLRMIRPHPCFRLFATMNPRYGEISRAMRNRAVELCLSSVPLPSLEGLTLCATAAPALSFRSPTFLHSSPSPLTFPSFSLEGVWSHFSQFHHEFVLQAFGANTLLPISSHLSDAYAAGSPNIFTLLRATSMVPSYLKKLMERARQEDEQERNEEENENKESIDDDDVCMTKVLGTCVLEVLKHCYLENRLGSWRRQIEVLENVIREKHVPLLQAQVLQWKRQDNFISSQSEEERSDQANIEKNIVKKEVEGDVAHTSDSKGELLTMLRSPAGHDNKKMNENSWFSHMALFEPRVEDAIQAFTLGSPSFLMDPTTPLCFSSTNSASATPLVSSSRLQLLSRRLLQCRVQRSGMALQKIVRQTEGNFHSLVHCSTSSSLRASHSLPDVLAAFVLEQVTDGAVLEEMAVTRREFLQQLISSSSDSNSADRTHVSFQEQHTNEACVEEEGEQAKRRSEAPFSSSMKWSFHDVLHRMQPLLHPQFCIPSQLPRLLSLTRLAIGPHAGVLHKAEKLVEDGLLLFISDSPSVNRAATRVVAVVVDALRRSASHPDLFQSLLGVGVSYLEEVFPNASESSTATLSTLLSPTVLTTAHFTSFVSRALLLIEGEAFTALPSSSTTAASPAASTLLPLLEQTREEWRSCVYDLLANVRRFLELPFPITADAPILQPLLSSVHITSPEERQVMTAYQKILHTEMKRVEAEKQTGKGALTVLRPLWETSAFRAEFALIQKLISLCATTPTMSSSSSSSLLGASSLVMDIGVFLSDFTERLPLYTALDLSLWASVRNVLIPASGISKSALKTPSNYSTPKENTPSFSALMTTKAAQKGKEEEKVSPPLKDGCDIWTDVRRYVPLVVVHFFERHRNIQDIHALFFGSWSTAACRCLRFASDVPVLCIGLGESQNPHAEALTSFFSFLSRCPKAPRDPLAAWRRNVEVELLQIIPLCFPSTKTFCDELLQAHPQRKRVGSVAESLYIGLPQMLDEIIAQEEQSASRSSSVGTTAPLSRKDWKLIQMLMDTLRSEEMASFERQSAPGTVPASSSSSLCFPLRAVALLCALKCRLLLPSSPVDYMYRRALQVDIARREMHTISNLWSTSVWAARISHRPTGVQEEEDEVGNAVPLPMMHDPHGTAVGRSHRTGGKICNGENAALPEVGCFPSFVPCADVPHSDILGTLHAQERERFERAADGLVTRPDPSGAQFADLTRELHRLVQTFFGDDRLQQVLPLPLLPAPHTNPLATEEEGVKVRGAIQRGSRHKAEGGIAMQPLRQHQQNTLDVWGELLLEETMSVLHQYGGYEDVTLHLAQSALFASITSSLFSFEWSSAPQCGLAMHKDAFTSTSTTTDSSSSSTVFTDPRLSAARDGRLLMDVPTILRQMQFPCALHSPVPLPLPSHSLSSFPAWSSSSSFSLFRFLNYLDSCLTVLSVAIPPSLDPSFASGLFASYRALYTHVEELNERERQAEELTVKYKDTNIVIEGDNEKMVKKLKDLFPSYESEFSALLKDREEEEEEDDEENNTNERQVREIGDGIGSEKDEKKNASRLGNQARTLFSQKSGFYVRHLVEVYTDYYRRLLDGRLDAQPFSMELHLESFKARFDTLATELREWSGKKTGASHGMKTGSMYDQLDDREECLLMSGFAARASLIRKEFFIPSTSVPTKNEAGFNIFKDPEPSEVSRFSAPLGRLLKRLEELLDEYPENVTLLHCRRVGHTIGQLKALETPLMKIMTGCEVLLTQCYEWERGASSAVSLMPNITELSAYILRWRRLELHSWGHIFKAKREELERTASLEWFTFYDLIHLEEKGQDIMGFQKADNEEDDLTRCLELFQHLSPYLWKASIGDFAARLRVVKGIAYELASRFGVTSPRTNVVLHIADFFSQFEGFVEEKCSAALKPLEEDMKEFCQIMRWEDANYYAVRATVEKSHLKVGRVLAALEDALRTPMLPLLTAEEERCLKDPAMGFPLPSEVDGDGKVQGERNGKKIKINVAKNAAKRNGNERGNEKKKEPVAIKRTRDGREKACSSVFCKQGKNENCGAEEFTSKKDTSGELISFADSAVRSWPAVAKAVRFFHNGAAEVIATVSSLQAPKVPQQFKLRSLKMMLDRLAGCGVPHTHEQQVEHWEVLYSSTEALLGGRSAFAHQLSTKSTAEDDRDHTFTRVVTSDALSATSLELYRFCRWVQRMREAERHPHQDLSGAQVKRGTGSVESLFAHLIQLSRWMFQLLELHDGLSALMQLVKDGVMHGKRDKTTTSVLPSTTMAVEQNAPFLLTSSSNSVYDGEKESAKRTLSEEYLPEGSHSEKASFASTELLNRSLQWVATLRSTTSSFHWLQKESLTADSRNTASEGITPTSTFSASPPFSSFLSSSSSVLSGVARGGTEAEGECTTLQVGYSTEDRATLMELHTETEKLREMCVDGEVLRHQSPILPLSAAQRFLQQHKRLLSVCCRLQQQHSDPVVRAAAALCARSLSTEITSWEDSFYYTPPHSFAVPCDSEKAVEVAQQQCGIGAELSSLHWHMKDGTMWPNRQRRRREVERVEEESERTPPFLPPSSEKNSSGVRSFVHEFSTLTQYCETLDVSFTLSTPTVQPDVCVENAAKQEEAKGQEEFPAPTLAHADLEGKREEDEDEKEVVEEEVGVYSAYVEQMHTMHTATERALRIVSSFLFMSPFCDAAGESQCVVPERLSMRAPVWWQTMSHDEGNAVYAQLQMAKRMVEEAKCGAIEALKSHAFFGVVLSRLLTVLLTNGFCKSSEEEEQDGNGEGEQGGVQEGTGMDDGQGEKDVTNEMENEDQLMNEKDQQEQGENEKNKGGEEDDEDHAADVETDFAGEKEGREEDEEDEESGSDQELGDVGEEDEVQERKKSRRDANDQEELNEDDGDAADEVPRDEFEENEENDDKETSGFPNKEEEIRKKEEEEEEEMDENASDRQIVGDEDEESEGTAEDGIEDDDSDSQSGRSREGSHEQEEEKEDHELPLEDNEEVDEDKKGDDEGQEGEEKEELDESLSREGEQDVEALSGEEENSQTDVESAEDAADENVFEGGQQDDRVGEEATENKEEHEERSKEQRRMKDATGTDEQQEQNDDEQDDAGRNWKEKQEENASVQRSDNTQQRRSEQSNPYKAMKEALQRHQSQPPRQLQLSKEVHVQNKKENQEEKDSRKPKPERQSDDQKDEDEEPVDHFEFDEEGEEEGMAATEEFAPPTVEEAEESNELEEENTEGAHEEDPEDERRKRKNPSDMTEISMEDEKEEKKEEQSRRQKNTQKKNKGKPTAALRQNEEEDDQSDKDGKDEANEEAPTVDEKLENGRRRWLEHEVSVQGLAQQLCEQLRLILAPTLADKLQGDYKTGKRLNMKRIIPYIASQFKKDRIWLRRTKPNKRTYQIMVALDDSLSMKCNEAGEFCCRAVTLMAKALQQLESGEVGIACFGEDTKLLHPLEEPFLAESGPRVFSEITFAQNSTKLSRFLEYTLGYLDTARERLYGQTRSTSQELMQLLYIFSDGQITENRADIRKLMVRAEENHQMVVFVILDVKAAEEKKEGSASELLSTDHKTTFASTTAATAVPLKPEDLKGLSAAERLRRLKADRERRLHRVQSQSILEMQLVEFKGGQVIRKGYMEEFPFPYYLIVREMDRLPEIIADSMRQWFELLNGH